MFKFNNKYQYIYVLIYIINIIYIFFKIFPVQKNKILFLSRQTNEPSIDFRMLQKEIVKLNPNIKLIFITKRIEKNFKDVISKNTFLLFKQMYHLATSKICIIDGYNIPISVLKHKKNLKIFQIWHSLGAIKKFGYQSLNTPEKKSIAKVMKMHKNYDFIICNSKEEAKILKEAFGYPNKVFHVYGLPRIEYLLTMKNQNRKKIFSKHPELKNRKIILYAPTFRDNDNNNYHIEKLINSIDKNKYIVIIKLHPNMNINLSKFKNVYFCQSFTTLQLLSITDYCITDYSAISLEAAIVNIPIFIYAYDLKKYEKHPGLNINLKKEFQDYVFDDPIELYNCLSKCQYNLNIVKQFCNKYITFQDKQITKRLAIFILTGGEINV